MEGHWKTGASVTESSHSAGSDWPLASIPDTQVRPISAGGATYCISIALPGGPTPAGGFPVLYLLDADAGFATVVETHRRLSRRPDATGVAPAAIVGIGHGSGGLYDPARRERDYVPRVLQPLQNGGAEAFLEFIETRLKPEIGATLAIDPHREALIGHSLSGYFTLWTLVRYPEAFRSYAAISPSLWRNEGLMADIPTIRGEISSVFIAAGEWEEGLAPWQAGHANSADIARRRAERRMVSNARIFADRLGDHIGAGRVRFEMFPDQDHASVFGVAINRALRMVSGPYLT